MPLQHLADPVHIGLGLLVPGLHIGQTVSAFFENGKEDSYRDFDTIEALNVLTEKEKAVVVLRFFEDQKLSEIARTLNENTNTVKTILYRSLKKLKLELTEGELSYEG